jgi:outer membrane protein assembly factor BamE (lipoprotein component of BamABCDE complex)
VNEGCAKKIEMAVLMGAVLSALCSVTLYACFYYPNIPFDERAWRNGGRRVRGSMVRDIMGRELLLGKSQEEVLQLLGEPEIRNQSQKAFFYSINTDALCTISPCDMMVFFDPQIMKVNYVAKADW